jgi:DNA primase
MKYPPQLIDQLKARLNIVDEVRKVAPGLKKKGRYWWACCPFHNEKSPSFHVREDQGSYYCFGCGASGDVLNFVQETQGGTFNDTVERLAKQAGLKLPEPERTDPATTQKRTDGYKALERSMVFFQRSINETCKAYMAKRRLSEATIEEFGLGYSPDSWDGLKNALLTEGFTPEILRETGLTLASDKGKADYDRFRNRLMFPIHNLKGQVVGFGGRVMGQGEPKYLNSAETPFFNKGFLLYNLNRAKPHLKSGSPLVICEGYMDVISLYQAGFKTAVAPMGTSITEDQLGLLWQNFPAPIVCLDGDSAGRNAALRVAHRALPVLEPGRTLQFVFLPPEDDPDSLVQKDGIQAFRALLAKPSTLEDVLWHQLSTMGDLKTADGKAAVQAEMGNLIGSIKNPTVRKAYGQSLREKFFMATRGPNSKAMAQPPITQAPRDYRPAIQGDVTVRTLLALVCRWPGLLPQVDEKLGTLDLSAGPLKELFQHIMRSYAVLQLAPEDMATDLAQGPHAHTVQEILISTGVEAMDEATDPTEIFMKTWALYQSQTLKKKNRADMMQKGDWFSPEAWSQFKDMKN